MGVCPHQQTDLCAERSFSEVSYRMAANETSVSVSAACCNSDARNGKISEPGDVGTFGKQDDSLQIIQLIGYFLIHPRYIASFSAVNKNNSESFCHKSHQRPASYLRFGNKRGFYYRRIDRNVDVA
jgi:hypothetical protein